MTRFLLLFNLLTGIDQIEPRNMGGPEQITLRHIPPIDGSRLIDGIYGHRPIHVEQIGSRLEVTT